MCLCFTALPGLYPPAAGLAPARPQALDEHPAGALRGTRAVHAGGARKRTLYCPYCPALHCSALFRVSTAPALRAAGAWPCGPANGTSICLPQLPLLQNKLVHAALQVAKEHGLTMVGGLAGWLAGCVLCGLAGWLAVCLWAGRQAFLVPPSPSAKQASSCSTHLLRFLLRCCCCCCCCCCRRCCVQMGVRVLLNNKNPLKPQLTASGKTILRQSDGMDKGEAVCMHVAVWCSTMRRGLASWAGGLAAFATGSMGGRRCLLPAASSLLPAR